MPVRSSARSRWHASIALVAVLAAGNAHAQQTASRSLSLAEAQEAARNTSPELRAAREALNAAVARERQSSAFVNPTLTYGREQTATSTATNSQNIAAVEQRVDVGGARAARIAAARIRREAAAAKLAAAESDLARDVARAYALALAADRRAALAEQTAQAFTRALTVSARRLAAGDVSGYEDRRIRLEAARYATVQAEAQLARRAARLALATFVVASPDSIASLDFELSDSLPTAAASVAVVRAALSGNARQVPDSLVRIALVSRADLLAVQLEASAADAEARQTRSERTPMPAFSLGFKNERIAGTSETATGFVAGLSLPLPLWDRRSGAIAAAGAAARQRAVEVDAYRRRVVREVAEAFDAYTALAIQLDALGPHLGPEANAALHAIHVAYAEGDASVVEWLDAVRAYQEAEASYAVLRAEAMIRRARFEHALGISPGPRSSSSHGAAVPFED